MLRLYYDKYGIQYVMQRTESVDFIGVGVILIGSTVFEIFGFYTCSSYFLRTIYRY